jgi:hypothetical protein
MAGLSLRTMVLSALARLAANHFPWFLLLKAVWIEGAAAGIEPGSPPGGRSLARAARRRPWEPTQARWASLPATADYR